MPGFLPRFLIFFLCFGLPLSSVGGQQAPPSAKGKSKGPTLSPEGVAFFEKKIRPVLVRDCYRCHSQGEKKPGGKLYLDSREGFLAGGLSGPVVIPGKAKESLLIQALHYDGLEMPPEKPLNQAVIADFIKWVEMGAPYPPGKTASKGIGSTEKTGGLWSLQPLQKMAPPPVKNAGWVLGSVDHFILSRLEAEGIAPVGEADARSLIRRLSFDLTGLPPTFEKAEQFVKDYANNPKAALEACVDELLASPAYGERWGRHWLDVARFGESNGNDGLSRNPTFPHAWRYRDYVIQAFNEDLPYDRFLTEQLAGDLLPAKSPQERDRLWIATGYLALGSKPAKAMNINFEMDIVADQIEAVGAGIMGLSVACARCHDHKHDPIPTRDYYALAGIFKSTETLYGFAANEPLTAPATELYQLKTMKAPPRLGNAAPPPPTGKEKPSKIKYPADAGLAMGVREFPKAQDCKINVQGESNKLGASVPRGFLQACNVEGPAIPADQSGRLQLAQWLTDPRHPLTSRVMANRIWHHLFGTGLVATLEDFGVYGEPPSHPELLDYLARSLMEKGWSIKKLIREIVLSKTYGLSSGDSDVGLQRDPDNRLAWRHARRRLDAESLRDSILFASGKLDLNPPQGSVISHLDILVNRAGNLHQPSAHRSVYLCRLRNSDPPELAAFDLPDPTKPVGARPITILPSQSLFFFNSPFMVEQSNYFGLYLLEALPVSASEADRIRIAYRRAYQRDPSSAEIERARDYLRSMESELSAEEKETGRLRGRVWASFAQALLAASEFRYVD